MPWQQRFYLRAGLFCAAAIWILARNPILVQEPRLFAEEGLLYFQEAYNSQSVFSGLTLTHSYYSLVPSVSTTIAAHFFPVEVAPVVTTLTAFLVQLISIGIICFSLSRIFGTLLDRAIFCAIVLIPITGKEVWLTTISSQFHLVIAAFLILVDDIDDESLRNRIYPWILGFAGLTGLLTCSLLPLFWLKWWRTRQRQWAVFASVLSIALSIQLTAVFVELTHHPEKFPARLMEKNIWNFLGMLWSKNFVLPFLGEKQTALFGEMFNTYLNSGDLTLIMLPIFLSLAAGTILIFWRLSTKNEGYSWLAFLWLSTFIFLGALGPNISVANPLFGARYFYPTNVLLLCCMYLTAKSLETPGKLLKLIMLLTVMVGLIQGASNYRQPAYDFAGFPNWKQEVQIWREQPDYALRIWPPNWRITLIRRDDATSVSR